MQTDHLGAAERVIVETLASRRMTHEQKTARLLKLIAAERQAAVAEHRGELPQDDAVYGPTLRESELYEAGRSDAAAGRPKRDALGNQSYYVKGYEATVQWIVFDWNGGRHEARVSEAPFPRSRLSEGQLVVGHTSGDYAISVDMHDGEFVANAVLEDIYSQPSAAQREP